MKGRHYTTKKPNSPTYNSQWSGVTYAPTVPGLVCEDCWGHLHKEGEDTYYCPRCDDFKNGEKGTPDD